MLGEHAHHLIGESAGGGIVDAVVSAVRGALPPHPRVPERTRRRVARRRVPSSTTGWCRFAACGDRRSSPEARSARRGPRSRLPHRHATAAVPVRVRIAPTRRTAFALAPAMNAASCSAAVPIGTPRGSPSPLLASREPSRGSRPASGRPLRRLLGGPRSRRDGRCPAAGSGDAGVLGDCQRGDRRSSPPCSHCRTTRLPAPGGGRAGGRARPRPGPAIGH